MTESECATKRIPVTPSTWRTVHQLRKPGQTYDDVIQELIQRDSEQKLMDETERIMKRGKFVPLSEIKSWSLKLASILTQSHLSILKTTRADELSDPDSRSWKMIPFRAKRETKNSWNSGMVSRFIVYISAISTLHFTKLWGSGCLSPK